MIDSRVDIKRTLTEQPIGTYAIAGGGLIVLLLGILSSKKKQKPQPPTVAQGRWTQIIG